MLPLSVHEQRPEIAKKLKLMNTELSKGIVKTDSQDMKVKIRSEGLDCENIQAPNSYPFLYEQHISLSSGF